MPSKADLLKENADLQARLTDAKETLRAIHMGEVDGLVVSTAQGNQIFTLQSADQPYRLMVEEMQEGAVTIGMDGTILYCNRRFKEILGYPSDQIVSQSIDQFIVLEEREKFRTFLNRVSSERDNHREFKCRTALNQLVPVYISANILQLEQTKVICLIVTDLSEKNRLEALARQSETRYRAVVNAMTEGVILMDGDTMIQACNPAAEHILGLTAEQMEGRTTFDLRWRAIYEDGSPFPGDMHPVSVTLRTGEPMNNVVMGLHQPDDTLRWILINAAPIQDQHNESPMHIVATFTDITDRKRSQEEIVRLANIVTFSNDAIVGETLDGIITSWNGGAERIFGYSADEMIQKSITTIMPPDRSNEGTELLHKIFAGEMVKSFDTVRLHKDGREVFVSITLSPIRDHTGDIIGASKIAHDITERKRAEEAIRFQARVLDTVGQAVIASDTEGKLIYWNRAAETLYGWSAEEAIGRNILELTPAKEHQQAEEILSRLQSGQSWSGDFYARRKDGTAFYALITNSPIIDEQSKVTGLIGISMDITERKQAEESIRFQAKLLNAVGQAVIATDMDAKIIYWNRSAETLYGWSAEEAMNRSILDLTPANTSRQQAEEILSRLQSGKSWSGEFRVQRKDRTAFPALVTDSPIFNDQGALIGIIGVSMDITERKRSEESLRKSEALLTQMGRIAKIGAWELNTKTSELTWSEEVYHIHEVDMDFDPTVDEGISFYAPSSQPIIEQAVQRAIEFGESYDLELEFITAKGNHIWVNALGTIQEQDDATRVIVGIFHDITERKTYEDKLRKLNRTLKLISGVNQSIVRVRNMSQLFKQVCHIAVEVGGFRMAWIGLIDSETGKVNPVAHAGITDEYLENLNISVEDEAQKLRPTVSAIRSGHYVIVNNIEQDARMIPWRKDALSLGYYAMAVLPLKVAGEVRGSFGLYVDTPQFFNDDEITLIEEMVSDISFAMEFAENEALRLRAEAELRDHMQTVEEMYVFLQTTLDAFPANTAVLGSDGTIINVNAPWVKFADENGGASPMRYVGQNYLTVCDTANSEGSNYAASTAAGIRAVINGLQEEFYLEYPSHSPFERRWFAVRVTPFPEPTPCRVVVAHINITQRREAEEKLKTMNHELEERVIERTTQLQDAKERVEAILNNSADVILLVNDDFSIAQTNFAFASLFGWEYDDYFGKSLKVLFKDSQADLNTQILEASTIQRSLSVDVEARRKDGSVFPAELTIGFIKNDGYVCVIHDISERKRIEQSLRAAVKREQELNELKSRFVSMASHEFRTPLAIIYAATETLSAYRQRLTDVQVEQKLTTVREQVGYLKNIMDDVLKLAQLQARRVAFNPATVDLDALCREIIDEYSSLEGFIHEVQYTCASNLPTARLDSKLMRQLFSNLLSNAIKYSLDDKRITVKLNYTDDMFVLIVRDYGIGIPKDDLKNLFEPFHRATNVGTIHGTGLGLVIAKESVGLHGGTISVESEVGVGTTFTVHLPI